MSEPRPDPVWTVERADALDWLRHLPDDSADLMLTSPPYEAARSYSIDFKLVGQKWVDWMVEVVRAAAPKVKGLIAVVCEGQTRGYRYSCAPFLLVADLHRAGFNLRKPPVFHRVGIPGSGGPDWLRNDYEPVVCVTRPGRLPWSDNTACGHPPKFAPGGAMAHRLTDGTRVNQWGKTGTEAGVNGEAQRRRDGGRQKASRPSHQMTTKRRATRGSADGDTTAMNGYDPPALANPGNVVECKVGGGLMGHDLAHENEAPFPLALAEFFVLSFCPPGGLVLDCFAGSGTTAHAAKKWGRSFAGCDVRESQVELCRRRLADVQPELFLPGSGRPVIPPGSPGGTQDGTDPEPPPAPTPDTGGDQAAGGDRAHQPLPGGLPEDGRVAGGEPEIALQLGQPLVGQPPPDAGPQPGG